MRKSKTVLGDICKITMGQSPDSSTYHTTNIGLPFYQGNADFGELYPKTRIWCSRPQKIAEPENILLSVRAPIGALNIAKEKCCIGRGLAAIAPHKNFCFNKYLFYILKYKHNELNAKGSGSTFKAINKSILNDLPIDIYPIDRQKKIAAILDKATELIALRKQQLEKLDLMVKSRFIEMFGNDQEFNRWSCCKIANVADITVGVVIKPAQYYTNCGIPAFRSLNIGEMVVRDKEWVFFTPEGHAKNKKSIIQENDILVIRSGAPGVACVATKKYAGYNAIDIIIARPNINKVNPIFLAMFTNLPHGMNQIRNKTGGAAQQHFNIGSYKGLDLILPPLHLQNEFAAFVEQVEKTKSTLQQSLKKLELNYKALMQTYFG